MVNIDTVYQRVLALANKEQRGYITPQEFNLFANQAQMDIFEQYFYDIDQFERRGNDNEKMGSADFGMVRKIQEKLRAFYNVATVSNGDDVSQYYKTRSVTCLNPNGDGKMYMAEEIYNGEDMYYPILHSPLLKPTVERPTYFIMGGLIYFMSGQIGSIGVNTLSTYDFSINYIEKPNKANWTYVLVGDKAMYNPSASDHQNFDLHQSEETKLVIKILALAGITLKDPALYQIATAEDNKNIQQEKQ